MAPLTIPSPVWPRRWPVAAGFFCRFRRSRHADTASATAAPRCAHLYASARLAVCRAVRHERQERRVAVLLLGEAPSDSERERLPGATLFQSVRSVCSSVRCSSSVDTQPNSAPSRMGRLSSAAGPARGSPADTTDLITCTAKGFAEDCFLRLSAWESDRSRPMKLLSS